MLYPFGSEKWRRRRGSPASRPAVGYDESRWCGHLLYWRRAPGHRPHAPVPEVREVGHTHNLMYPEMAAGSSEPRLRPFRSGSRRRGERRQLRGDRHPSPRPESHGGTTVHLTDLDAHGELPLTIRHIYGASSPWETGRLPASNISERLMMRLELARHPVQEIRFSDTTRFSDGVLHVSKDEIREIVTRSGPFQDAECMLLNRETRPA